jgi:predicted RecA/RadA family phage recombinase
MDNFVQKGEALDLTAPYDVASGGGFKVGAIIAIASSAALSGASVVGNVIGVYDVTSDTGAAWSIGDVVYWDDTNKRFTKTTTSNTKSGVAVAAKTSGATTGRVRLIPSI